MNNHGVTVNTVLGKLLHIASGESLLGCKPQTKCKEDIDALPTYLLL